MSDSEEEELEGRRQQKEAMPEYKMRFTDMPPELVEKAIRCKSNYDILILYFQL